MTESLRYALCCTVSMVEGFDLQSAEAALRALVPLGALVLARLGCFSASTFGPVDLFDSGDIAPTSHLVKDGTLIGPHFALNGSATVEQESSEEGGEFVVRVQRQHVRNVLVRTNDDHRPLLAVDAAQVEDVGAVLEVGRVGLLVVDQARTAPCAEAESTAALRP